MSWSPILAVMDPRYLLVFTDVQVVCTTVQPSTVKLAVTRRFVFCRAATCIWHSAGMCYSARHWFDRRNYIACGDERHRRASSCALWRDTWPRTQCIAKGQLAYLQESEPLPANITGFPCFCVAATNFCSRAVFSAKSKDVPLNWKVKNYFKDSWNLNKTNAHLVPFFTYNPNKNRTKYTMSDLLNRDCREFVGSETCYKGMTCWFEHIIAEGNCCSL
jgi:hypothetical protein